MISELYDLEDGYGMRGLNEQDITVERQGEYTEDIVRRIRKRLDEELRKDNEFRSSYMMQALNYLDHFWVILHFGSDEGVDMSVVYHSIISTFEIMLQISLELLRRLLPCEVLGLDTYKEYLPALSR